MKRLITIVAVLILSSIVFASEKKDTPNVIKGFRNITWGMTPDDAKKVYPDIEFAWKSTEENIIYKRSAEEFKIGETDFDEIRYSFKSNKFTKVIAILESKSGIMSSAHLSTNEYLAKNPTINFNKMKDMIESKYGACTYYKEDIGKKKYGIDPLYKGLKKAEWVIGESRITLELMTGSKIASIKKNKSIDGEKDNLTFYIEYISPVKLGF